MAARNCRVENLSTRDPSAKNGPTYKINLQAQTLRRIRGRTGLRKDRHASQE